METFLNDKRRETPDEYSKRMIEALSKGVEAGKKIREAELNGASIQEIREMERKAIGIPLTGEDEGDPLVFTVIRGGKARS